MSALTSDFYFKRAKKYRKCGLNDSALRDYTTVVQIDPSHVKAHNNRGNIYYDQEEYQKAIEDYSRAIELAPEAPSSYCGRGLCHERLRDYTSALEDLNTAIVLENSKASYHYNRGNVWYELQEFDKAMEDYTAALCRDPGYSLAFYNRGMAWKQLKKYDLAINDFTEAIRLKPDYSFAYFNRADTWSLLYMFGDAKCDYERGLSYFDNDSARIYLSQCVEKIRQYENDACKYTEQIRTNPELPENIFGRALCYYYQGKYDQAISDFSYLLEKCPDDELFIRYLQDCNRKRMKNPLTAALR